MDKAKESLLTDTLTRVYNIVFGTDSLSGLKELFTEDLIVIGTAIDEKYVAVDGVRQMVQHQRDQSEGMKVSFHRRRCPGYM
jgi:hypothetical protein